MHLHARFAQLTPKEIAWNQPPPTIFLTFFSDLPPQVQD